MNKSFLLYCCQDIIIKMTFSKAIENVKGQLTPVLLEDKQVVALLTKEISRRFGLEKVAI